MEDTWKSFLSIYKKTWENSDWKTSNKRKKDIWFWNLSKLGAINNIIHIREVNLHWMYLFTTKNRDRWHFALRDPTFGLLTTCAKPELMIEPYKSANYWYFYYFGLKEIFPVKYIFWCFNETWKPIFQFKSFCFLRILEVTFLIFDI